MSFTLILDTRPPGNPTLLLNGGAALTGSRDVTLTIGTSDFEAGARDVAMMKLWGDVDPTIDPDVQPSEGASAWQAFQVEYTVRLAMNSGRKTVYARLRDDVFNTTLPFSDFIDLDVAIPVVTVTTAVDRGRISKIPPADTAIFTWESNLTFDRYEVRVVPTTGSPQSAGVVIPTAGGSIATSGSGAFNATTPITTTIKGADLEAASPGDTTKIVKVFVRSVGRWSS